VAIFWINHPALARVSESLSPSPQRRSSLSIRKVLAWYLGALLFVGVTGASAYRAIEQQRLQQAATAADVKPAATVAIAETPPAPEAAEAPPALPQLRPHVAASARKPSAARSSVRTAEASKSTTHRASARPPVPTPYYAYRVYDPSRSGYAYYAYYPRYGYYPYAYYSAY
jgi:hypothetical protein